MNNLKKINFFLFLFAMALSLAWSLLIYPSLSDVYFNYLDADNWGALGISIWQKGTFSYYPHVDPSIQRGPLYPLFIGALLWMSGGLFPVAVQCGQSVLFGATCSLTHWIATRLFNSKTALIAGILCAIHPFLLWYAGKIYIETFSTFIYTGITAATVWMALSPSKWRAIVLGLMLGLGALTKATFLPFLLFTPLFFLIVRPRTSFSNAVLIALVGILTITPWTIRNYHLTGRFIAIQALSGYNLQRGDDFVDHAKEAPFSYSKLWAISNKTNPRFQDAKQPSFNSSLQFELWFEDETRKQSIDRYWKDPGFLLEKMGYNAITFWFLSNTNTTTALLFLLQAPLLYFFIRSIVRLYKERAFDSALMIPLLMLLVYYAGHLPIIAFARLSAVLIPTMLVYACRWKVR